MVPSAHASNKKTKYMKPGFTPPVGDDLVDSSDSSAEEDTYVAPKRTKKFPSQFQSPIDKEMTSKKSTPSIAQPDVDVQQKTKDSPPISLPEIAALFEDSDGSEVANVAPLMKTVADSNPSPITLPRLKKQDKRKTIFTMINDPQYSLFLDSFTKSLPMFQEPSSGLLLSAYFDQKEMKGFRLRCSNKKYPFDGREERLVDDGK